METTRREHNGLMGGRENRLGGKEVQCWQETSYHVRHLSLFSTAFKLLGVFNKLV